MALKNIYHEDALADLKEIFDWSRKKHPETTEHFADDLFDHIELLQALPYIGAPIKRTSSPPAALHSPLYVYGWENASTTTSPIEQKDASAAGCTRLRTRSLASVLQGRRLPFVEIRTTLHYASHFATRLRRIVHALFQ